jgi:hypothetical protein
LAASNVAEAMESARPDMLADLQALRLAYQECRRVLEDFRPDDVPYV